MKKLFPFLLLIVAVLGCDLSRFTGGKNASTNTNRPTPETKSTPVPTPKPEATPWAPAFIATLKKSVGKYPYEIKLLDIPELKDRLKKLLGKDFPDMKAHWNVETPMEMENGVFKASACEAHNCAANNYLMFVDLKGDNINVYHIVEGDGPRHFFESGEMNLPAKFANELKADN